MNVVENLWLEVLILWVLELQLKKFSIFHHIKDLDYNLLFIRLILGMVNL